MNIYIDFDDCLCETGRAFATLVSDLFGKDIPYEEMEYFNLREAFGLTEEQYAKLLVKGHEPGLLLSFAETPGASAVINEWIDAGHSVSIVTGRPSAAYDTSRAWLDSHGLARVRLYCLDKYGRDTYLSDCDFSLSLEDYYRMRFDVAVEDSPLAFRFFSHLPDLQVLVFDRPWNRAAAFPGPNYRRCPDWQTIRAAVAELRKDQ